MLKLRHLIVFVLIGLMTLTACTGVEQTSSTVAPSVIDQVEDNSQATSSEAAPQADLTDLSLIANSSRPQFLNAYTNW